MQIIPLTGLSYATVHAAFDSFETGGWNAFVLLCEGAQEAMNECSVRHKKTPSNE